MPQPPLLIAATLLLAAAGAAPAAAERCGRGDAWQQAAAGERALARADWPQAARLYGCAAAASADPALAERATRVAYDNGLHEAAAGQARHWLSIQPASEPAQRYLAVSQLRLYDDAGAAAGFAALLAHSTEDRARGYLSLLGMLSQEGNETGAARVMERLAAAGPEIAEAQYAASVLWQRAEDGARALAAARRALALRPDWRLAELAEVQALATRGEQAAALERVAALARDGDPFTLLTHAWLLLGAERRAEAAAAFEDLRRAGGAAAGEAIAGLAAIAIDERRFADAIRLQDEAARDPEQQDSARWYRARIAEEQGETAGAAAQYERLRTGPRATTAQLRAYRLWRGLGEHARAEMLLDDYLAADPAATREVVAGVASQLAEEGRSEAAIALMDRALAALPDDDLRLARGFLLERIDRVPEAIADLRAVLDRRPGDPVVQNALGYTLVDRTRSLEEGQRLIEAALASKPDSYAVQDSMGWALVRRGRLEEGRAWLETAWARSEDPEIAAHLGEAYWLLGREDDARRIWQETLTKHPDSRPLQRAIGRHAP